MTYTLRPLPEWPHKPTSPRKNAQFRSPSRREGEHWVSSKPISWEQTRRELQYEVDQLSDSRYPDTGGETASERDFDAAVSGYRIPGRSNRGCTHGGYARASAGTVAKTQAAPLVQQAPLTPCQQKILSAVRRHGGNRSRAAAELEMSLTGVCYVLERLPVGVAVPPAVRGRPRVVRTAVA